MDSKEFIESLSPYMYPLYYDLPWRHRLAPQTVAIVINTQTNERFLTPYVDLPYQRLIFPSSSNATYRVIASMHVDDASYFDDVSALENCYELFDNFAHSSVTSYAMVVAGAFVSLSHLAPTMETWKVQAMSDSIDKGAIELSYFTAATMVEHEVSRESLVFEASKFVHNLTVALGLPNFSQVIQQRVYDGCLQFLADYDTENSPQLLDNGDEETRLPGFDADYWETELGFITTESEGDE